MILTPFLTALCAPALPAADVAPVGRYVEARTASVYAGACHYGGESVTDGCEALLAWRFDAGTVDGVDLSGLVLAALVVDDSNLAAASARRRAVLYTNAGTSPREVAALQNWARARHAALLGEIVAVRTVPLSVTVGESAFAVRAAGTFALVGDALPDRACCKMPFDVWYSPLESLSARLVGRDDTFDVTEPLLARMWSRPGENAAFFGTFGR